MNKNKLKKTGKDLWKLHPVLLAQAGLVLLVLPLFVPIEDNNKAIAVFIASVVLILYGCGFAVVDEIQRLKSFSNKEIDRKVKQELAKRKQITLQNQRQKNGR